MTHYQILLFDADGTLFDYESAEASALQQTFVQYGVSWQPEFLKTYRQINAEVWALLELGRISPQRLSIERFHELLQTLSLDLSPANFSRDYLQNIAKCAELIEDAEQVVVSLADSYRLVILTNGLKAVQHARLKRTPIHPYISDMIISEDVGVAKPEEAIFLAAFERLGQPPKDAVLMIGDSLSSDIRGAANFGIDSCWYNPSAKPAPSDIPITYEIQHLAALLTLLGKSS